MATIKKDNKTEFKWFTISQYEEEEDYLSLRHSQGWKLTGIGFPGFYHFTKCEPEEVRYQLDYNQDSMMNRESYIQMFEDLGWEYLMNFVGYSYFCKPVAKMSDKDEGIFCDDQSKLDMLKRVIKGRMLPLLIIFFSMIIPQMMLQLSLHGSLHNIMFMIYLLLFSLYLSIFAWVGWEYVKLRDKIGVKQ